MPARTRRRDVPPERYSLDEQIGHLLRRAYQRAAATFMATSRSVATPMQFAVLARLWEKGRVSQNELGRLAAMDPPTVHGVVRRLRERRFITSLRDPADRRLILYQLTPSGRRLVRELIELEAVTTARILAPLSIPQRHQLLDLLRPIAWEPTSAVLGIRRAQELAALEGAATRKRRTKN